MSLPDCACGTPTPTEAAARRHAAVCELSGHPAGCRVTVYYRTDGPMESSKWLPRPCGATCVRDQLCAHHAGERERLGGGGS